MSALAPLLQSFFLERLGRQRQASPQTISAYRDCFKLLLAFAARQRGKPPSRLQVEDLDAGLIAAFLDHLEHQRHNSVRTRNARLAAVHSLFSYAALRCPEQAATIERVLAIPQKRFQPALVSFLDHQEVAALLRAPDRTSWTGRRDHALLAVAAESGLRVSELTALRIADMRTGSSTYLRCQGKGRKERSTPLTSATSAVLRTWLKERGGSEQDPVFPTRKGGALGRSAVEHLIAKYAALAASNHPPLASRHVTPHVLRHTAAMALLHAGVDTSVITLWLGHQSVETTQIYLHADMTIKEQALARTTPPETTPGRYKPPDALLAFLDRL